MSSLADSPAREREPRRAEVLLRMAEAGHRCRIEERQRRLGVEPPDPTSVRVPRWTLLQARVAPVGRVLAAREAAESAEIGDRYLCPTGDPETDSQPASRGRLGQRSMAAGEAEVAAANLARKRLEIEELSLFLQLRGLEPAGADDLARRLSANPEAMLQLMATEELGGAAVAPGGPAKAALAAGVVVGAATYAVGLLC